MQACVVGSSSSEHAYLTCLKECVSEGSNLNYLSDAVMLVLKSCEEHFNGITTWTKSVFTMKFPLKAVTAYLTDAAAWRNGHMSGTQRNRREAPRVKLRETETACAPEASSSNGN